MKSLLLLTASGPLLILTSHESLTDQKLLEVLRQKASASSSRLRSHCRSPGSATAGIFKPSKAICTRRMI